MLPLLLTRAARRLPSLEEAMEVQMALGAADGVHVPPLLVDV
jgi:hypothetical protein